MENEIENEDKDKTKEETFYEIPKKQKILSNKAKNYLINLISHLMNNKNNFEEKIKPSELEFKLETDSDNSYVDKIIYKLHIYYNSFNIKRDKIKNISKYKEIPSFIEVKDEYYSSKLIFQQIYLDIYPLIKKGINLDLSYFPFYSFNKENKQIDKFKFKSNNNINNKYILSLYITQTDDNSINKVDKVVEKLNTTNNIWIYFETIYVIFQVNTIEQINKLIYNDNINKYVLLENNNDNNKIIYLFNILTNYEINSTNDDNLINIFQNKKNNNSTKDKEKDYFFILDQKYKIIKLKNLSVLSETISYFLFNLKRNNNNSYISKEKEISKITKLKKTKELLYFISQIKNLDYIFDINFKISINITINDELTDIELKKINSIEMFGNFYKKEYNYLMELFNLIRQRNCKFNAKEIATVDIDIDFKDMECYKCTCIIQEEKYFYYCYICKTKYCIECIQNQLKKKGKAKYIDPKHNLLFLKKRNKKQFLNIDKFKLGSNKFTLCIDDNDFNNKHSANCCGCKTDIVGTERYICLNCRKGLNAGNTFIDYCGKCIEKMCNNKEEMAKLESGANGIIYNQNSNVFTKEHKVSVCHKHEEHIYLMLPLQVQYSNDIPYYNF